LFRAETHWLTDLQLYETGIDITNSSEIMNNSSYLQNQRCLDNDNYTVDLQERMGNNSKVKA